MANDRDLGEQLRHLRLERDLSQRRLAGLVEPLTHQALSKIERGDHVPSLVTLAALAKALGVRVTIEGGEIRLEPESPG